MADNRRRMPDIVLRGEPSAQRGINAKHAEIFGGDVFSQQAVGVAVIGDVSFNGAPCSERAEGLRLFLQIDKVREGYTPASTLTNAFPEIDQALRVGVGQ